MVSNKEMGHQSILIVDDEIVICELIKEILSENGYSVEYAVTAEDAVLKFTSRKIEGKPYQIAIVDIGMGREDSRHTIIPVLKEIDNNIGIIMISGSLQELESIKDTELEIATKLQKPFRAGELLDAVESLFDRRPS